MTALAPAAGLHAGQENGNGSDWPIPSKQETLGGAEGDEGDIRTRPITDAATAPSVPVAEEPVNCVSVRGRLKQYEQHSARRQANAVPGATRASSQSGNGCNGADGAAGRTQPRQAMPTRQAAIGVDLGAGNRGHVRRHAFGHAEDIASPSSMDSTDGDSPRHSSIESNDTTDAAHPLGEKKPSIPFHHILDMFEHRTVSPPASPQYCPDVPHRLVRRGAANSELEIGDHGRSHSRQSDSCEDYEMIPISATKLPNGSCGGGGMADDPKTRGMVLMPTVRKMFSRSPTAVEQIENKLCVSMGNDAVAGGRVQTTPIPGDQLPHMTQTTPRAQYSRGPACAGDQWKQEGAGGTIPGKLGGSVCGMAESNHASVWRSGVSISAATSVGGTSDEDGTSRLSASSQQSAQSEPTRGRLQPSVEGRAMVRRKAKNWKHRDHYFCVPVLHEMERSVYGLHFKQIGITYLHFVGHTLVRQVKVLHDGTAEATVNDFKVFCPASGPHGPLNRFRKQQSSGEKFEEVWEMFRHTLARNTTEYEPGVAAGRIVAVENGKKKGKFSSFLGLKGGGSGVEPRSTVRKQQKSEGRECRQQTDTVAALQLQPVGV